MLTRPAVREAADVTGLAQAVKRGRDAFRTHWLSKCSRAGHGTGINECGQTGGVKVAVTEIAWDGSLRRRALDTSALTGPGRWEALIEQVLSVPPAYRATPGRPVYVIRAGDRAVVVGEENLVGSLQDLVTTILATGDLA